MAPPDRTTPSQLRPLPNVEMTLLPEQVRAQRARRGIAIALGVLALVAGALAWAQPRYGLALQDWLGERLAFMSEEPNQEPIALPAASGSEKDGAGVRAGAVADTGTGTDTLSGADGEAGTRTDSVSLDDASPPAAATVADPGPIERPLRQLESEPSAQHSTLFGRARSFREALLNAGLEPEECVRVERSLRHVVDFRRCRPGHRLVVERNDAGELSRFEYHPTATEFVELTRTPSGELSAKQVRVQVARSVVAKAASVDKSIRDSLTATDLPAGLSAFFVEAFEGRINFPLQARKGDVFRLLVDEERLDGRLLRYGTVRAIEYKGQRTGTLRAFYYDTVDGDGRYYDENGRAMQGGRIRTPLRYERISSRFNPKRFHPILKRRVPHLGVDYAARTGTPVWAAADGVVKFAGRQGPNGNMVAIRHGGGVQTSYSHLHRIRPGIRKGTRVKQRELIGVVGSTGRSTGPHLHFAIKKHNRLVDPAAELNGPGRKLPSKYMDDFKERVAELTATLDSMTGVPALQQSADVPVEEPIDEIMD